MLFHLLEASGIAFFLVATIRLLLKFKFRLPVSPATRRKRYDFLKNEIKQRHFEGYAGLIVNSEWSIDEKDIACFKAPMYWVVKNKDWKWCIFWDRNKMTEEVGTGAPLREGEVLEAQPQGRIMPKDLSTNIDEQKPLTQQAASVN